MELLVSTREKLGKSVKTLRKQGTIPAELYGRGIENTHLSVPVKEFTKVFKEAGENTVVTLVIGKEKKPAIISDVQYHFVTGDIAHIDFYQVRLDEAITAMIPFEFVGEAPAIREKGAVINKSMTEIEVEALPQDLPHRITIDLSVLDDMDKSIYVRDIVMPKGVKVLSEADAAIATAMPPAAEEVVEAPAADISEVKVETEEKKAAREAGKTEKADTE